MLTGDAANADPVCEKSAMRERVVAAVEYAQIPDAQRVNAKPLVFRDPKNSRALGLGEAATTVQNG
jgi:pyrroloquinoline quinone biosynthesis protein E